MPQSAQNSTDRIERGVGSGVIVSADGTILTNHHVVEGAEKITVQMNDNKTYEAKVVGSDPPSDLAVLKIEGAKSAVFESRKFRQRPRRRYRSGDRKSSGHRANRNSRNHFAQKVAGRVSATAVSRIFCKPTRRSITEIPAARWLISRRTDRHQFANFFGGIPAEISASDFLFRRIWRNPSWNNS